MLLAGGLLFPWIEFSYTSFDQPLVYRPRVGATQQQFSADSWSPASVPQGWMGSLEYKLTARFSATAQQFSAEISGTSASLSIPTGWSSAFPESFGKPRSVANQQFSDIIVATVSADVPVVSGWYSDLNYRFAKALNVVLQEFWFGYRSLPPLPVPELVYNSWAPTQSNYRSYLEKVKSRERLRWAQLTQQEKRRVRIRAAIEFAHHGPPPIEAAIDAPEPIPSTPIAKPVLLDGGTESIAQAIRQLGLTVQRKDYDVIQSAIREYEYQTDPDRIDEQEVELLLYNTMGTVVPFKAEGLDEEDVELLLLH